MMKIGQLNKLKVNKHVDFGLFLDNGEGGEILLPRKYILDNCQPGDTLEVFIYYDSEDRLIATTESPLAQVGEFANLKVVSTTSVGAFLDWGLSKDLFLPFAEQSRRIAVGDTLLVYVYLDNTGRIAASMRIERHLEKISKEFSQEYTADQSVELMICGETDLGYKAIINGKHLGMLYHNEVFQSLKQGQRLSGFIRKVREEDGKIDLGLLKTGHQGAENISPKILELLEKSNGYLPINDKTSAEKIYELFGVSKKKYKIALGGLYKKRLISIEEEGIRLLSPQKPEQA
ncbi:MAG: CvfB family protein [Pseudobdellovibrionaceae bacterium]